VRAWLAPNPHGLVTIIATGDSIEAVLAGPGKPADVLVLDLELGGVMVTDRVAGSDKRRFGSCKRCRGSGRRQRAAPGLSAAPCPAPSTARRTDVHKQDHRDRTIPAAVIVVVLFVAILAAALIWLAAT
jgi:hypothetical protein